MRECQTCLETWGRTGNGMISANLDTYNILTARSFFRLGPWYCSVHILPTSNIEKIHNEVVYLTRCASVKLVLKPGVRNGNGMISANLDTYNILTARSFFRLGPWYCSVQLVKSCIEHNLFGSKSHSEMFSMFW
jgi:hypothetical protein